MSDEPVKILLVEDDRDCYLLTMFALEDAAPGRFELEWCGHAEEAEEVIARREHDLYFVDYRLGEIDGVEIIGRARKAGIDTPMILFTGMEDPRVVARASEAGADDYFLKGKIDPERLALALEAGQAAGARRRGELDGSSSAIAV